jgi:Uma2 family endonuclease
MADAAHLPKRLTVREFLEWEERQPQRYELIDGLVRMMAGGTKDHGTIKLNIASLLRTRLRGGPCRAFDSDLKVRTAGGQVCYPDVTVDCGRQDGAATEASQPTVIFEVLSKSTRETDLNDKLPKYQATPSIRQIVYVEPDRMHLMVWRRTDDGWEEDEVVHPEAHLELTPLHIDLLLKDFYEDVSFEG